jgi:hypothetical protein
MMLVPHDQPEEAVLLAQYRAGLRAFSHDPISFNLPALNVPISIGQSLTLRAGQITHVIVAVQAPHLIPEQYRQGLAVQLPEAFSVFGIQRHQSRLFIYFEGAVWMSIPITGLWIPAEHPSRDRWLVEGQFLL